MMTIDAQTVLDGGDLGQISFDYDPIYDRTECCNAPGSIPAPGRLSAKLDKIQTPTL